MTLKELERIVAGGENKFVEFKHKINFPDKIAREIVAFANTKGGKLFVGVDDNKQIFGLKNADEEVFALQQLIRNFIKYPVDYQLIKVQVHPKKEVICLEIPEAKRKPNFAMESVKDRFGTAFVRVADKSVKASDEMIKILKLNSNETQGRLLTFGENEKKLMQLTTQNPFLTLKIVADTLLMSNSTASDLLVSLVVSNVLEIIPEEGKEDRYKSVN
ncbi:MAG: helix-turn-helix domain-containing protein [Cytophagales bacterium]